MLRVTNLSRHCRRVTIAEKRHFGAAKNVGFLPSAEEINQFRRDGFIIIPRFIGTTLAQKLVDRLDPLFSGKFETGHYPDEWHWRQGLSLPDVTREICNAWKCDKTIASLVLSQQIGQIATLLGGWKGARIGQDDIWMKPPQRGKEISFHTDCAYIPWPEVTFWVALDDVSARSGTLEYVRGSHKWTKYQDLLDTNSFHSPNTSYKTSLIDAAKAEGISQGELEKLIVKVEVPAGGVAIHNGLTWHGSGINTSNNWRRSIGIHVIDSESSFSGKNKNVGYIYGRYKLQDSDEMNESFFPILYRQDGHRTKWLSKYCEDCLS
eukprot:TRINITY_DN9469_c0_g1_i5.p1 TRINITY_DN9469_c0_g1~~TRINITY_DN9469_c0_g1_i5.p1  ORF type:complete len:321 (+),score=44.53 TRINITY_DN9469_c0_g1_i5:41-1003(+)